MAAAPEDLDRTTAWQQESGSTTAPLATVEARGRRRAGLRVLLTRYLAAAVVLLGVVLVVDPHDPEVRAPAAQPWRYQQEQIDVEGSGLLNVYARGALHLSAWMTRSSIERLREVSRLNLLDFLVGSPTANRLSGWRQSYGFALEGSTKLAVLLLVGYGVLVRPSGRGWAVALLLLLSLTLAVTRPHTTVRLASAPSVALPSLVTEGFDRLDPVAAPARGRSADEVQQALVGAYWDSFVGNPLSRMQTGSPVLAGAAPASKPGVLASLRRSIADVNDWAVGRRGWERAFIASTALAYAVPLSVAIAALAMLATSAQAVLFLLCLAGLVMVPLWVDRRRRPAAFRYWLLPLPGTVGVLAAATMAALVVRRAGQGLHRSDEYLGLLLAGSTWPVVVALLVRRTARRRRVGPAGDGASKEASP